VPEQLLELVEQEIAVLVDRRPFDHRALALTQEVPRHDVGMVLHDREHDLVAFLDALATEGIGDQVDRLGGVAGEDDLFLAPGIEELLHGLARALVGLGCFVGEIMQATVYVGVLLGIGLVDAVEHRLRLLRRGRVVEIDQRLAVDLHRQRREVRADAVDVEGSVGHCRVHAQPRDFIQSMAAFISASRIASLPISSTTSPMKAWISSASASGSVMPRDIK